MSITYQFICTRSTRIGLEQARVSALCAMLSAPCALPMFPGMADADVNYIIKAVREVVLRYRRNGVC